MILGVDPGDRRIGIAVADQETRFARPLEVIDAQITDPVARVAELVRELDVETIVVGRPLSLSGRAGPSVAAQQKLVERVRESVTVPVVEFDERLTTVVAEQALSRGGASRRARKRVRDAIAAQVMLQGYLDSQK